jgi:hypothetical protein
MKCFIKIARATAYYAFLLRWGLKTITRPKYKVVEDEDELGNWLERKDE